MDAFRLSGIVLVVNKDPGVAETRSFLESGRVGYYRFELFGKSDNVYVQLDYGFCNSEEPARLEGLSPLRSAYMIRLLGILESENNRE